MKNDLLNEIHIETMIIIVLLMVIVCFLFPITLSVINNVQLSSVEDSATFSVKSVQTLYLSLSIDSQIDLPFTVEYTEEGYVAYSGDTALSVDDVLESSGRKPVSGKIVINSEGTISVVNLEYSDYICSAAPSQDVTCTKKV